MGLLTAASLALVVASSSSVIVKPLVELTERDALRMELDLSIPARTCASFVMAKLVVLGALGGPAGIEYLNGVVVEVDLDAGTVTFSSPTDRELGLTCTPRGELVRNDPWEDAD